MASNGQITAWKYVITAEKLAAGAVSQSGPDEAEGRLPFLVLADRASEHPRLSFTSGPDNVATA